MNSPALRRPLYGWLTADGISVTGTRISMIAIPLFVLQTTGSPARTGIVALAEMLPLVLTKLLGGPVIDRVGPRRVSISCDVASLGVVGLIPLLHAAGMLAFPLFVALMALAGSLRGPGDAAKHALAPTLVEHAGVPMERATGLSSMVERTASMAGAGLAGVLVALVGPADAIVVDAISFGVSALVLAWATSSVPGGASAEPGQPGQPRQPDVDEPYLRQLHEGWSFLRHDRVLLAMAVMVALTNMIDAAWASVLMPVWSIDSGRGAAVLGLLFAVWSGCSAIGSAAAALWAERLPRYLVYLTAFLITGLPRFAVMAVDSPVLLIVVVFAAGGLASGFLNPILGAVQFERIPAHLTGRVSSMSTALCWGLMPLGGLLGGLLVGSWSLAAAMLACGVAYFAVTMLPAIDPTWRQIDRRPRREVTGVGAAAV